MCGICGVVHFDQQPVDPNELGFMTDLLYHRGPDFGDIFIDNNIGLGHRRLSIIDLSEAAKQPMQYDKSGYYISFNGEIYNYIELKKELQKAGYYFKTESDTEVILASFIHWGEECFHKFNGMWALAIYNENSKELLLCRDRFGIKPLYYSSNESQFIFASEKKAIALSHYSDCAFDPKAFKTAIFDPFRLEASRYTEFLNIKNLLPGEILIINNNKLTVKKWYNLIDEIDTDIPSTFEERSEKLRDLLIDSCRLRLRSDVPLATSLSGGIDSSCIVLILSQIDKLKHEAFVHSFKGTPLDETKFAEIVCSTTGTPMNSLSVDKNEILYQIDDILFFFESIYCGMPDSLYRVYKCQKNAGYKISMDGHGADEMLGGYPWYLNEKLLDLNVFQLNKWHETIKHINEISDDKKNKQKLIITKSLFKRLPESSQLKLKRIFRGRDYMTDLYDYIFPKNIPKSFSNLKRRLFIDFTCSVLPRILKNFDAMSMANSVEVRMPFMDYRLVQYIFGLPDSDLIQNGWTKYILRNSFSNYLDHRVLWRKDKKGFNSPVAEILKGELREWTLDAVNKAKVFGYNSDRLALDYENKICKNDSWEESLNFWKDINAVKLLEIFRKKKQEANRSRPNFFFNKNF